MRLTQESPRTRWLIMLGAWALVAALVLWHTRATRDYIAVLDGAGLRGGTATTPLRRPCPSNFADAQTWLRYALALQEGAPWQVRFTDIDNAPAGREVHWNSAFAHLIAAAGRIEQARTGGPLPLATERALAWFNLPLFLGLAVLFSAWMARRAGAGAGVIVVLGMFGLPAFFDGFTPNYVDHHGLLTAAAFGVALGAVFMGGGWWQAGATGLLPESRATARGAATFSAACGAVGMWISAASVIPAIAITGVAGLVAVWAAGRRAQNESAQFEPGLWRWWGRVGGAGTLLFYLVEYAPSHFGWRLEANHPLYALAWWGGGELIAEVAQRELGSRGRAAWRLVLPTLAVAAAPLVIAVGGPKVFSLLDPGLADLHSQIAEFLSLPAAVRELGWSHLGWDTAISVVLLGAAAWALVVRRSGRVLLVFAAAVMAGFFAVACWQIRWKLPASGPQLGLLLVLLAIAMEGRGRGTRWALVLALALGGLLPPAIYRVRLLEGVMRRHEADRVDLMQPVFRDIAATLRTSQPSGEIVLLASPNASTGIGYYGRFKTLGTLYWENAAGLKAAAEIFSATNVEEARALVRAHGVTHLAIISEGNFLADYFHLARPAAPPGEIDRSLGHEIFFHRRLPPWLRLVPYRPPPDVLLPNLDVVLLQVVPDQTQAQILWNFAEAQLALGDAALAEKNFLAAIAAAPATTRAGSAFAAGNLCYQQGAQAAAARFYRMVLAAGDEPAVARNLAWLLATSTDATVRNGPEALALVEKIADQFPNDHAFVNIVAAALAENGRFAEAVATAERALALARAAGNKNVETLVAQRIEAYRAGRPWRQ